jgi:signal transduction histidine kinase
MVESLETFAFAHGSTMLVRLSAPTTSIWWLLYFALCVYDASATGTRRISGVIIITAPLTAATVTYARTHAGADALAAVIIGALGVVAWGVIGKGTERSLVSLAERESLGERIVELERERNEMRAYTERRHIAMELHDGVGATLAAARLMAQTMRDEGATSERAGTLEALETLDRTLRDGLSDLRLAVWSLDHARLPWSELLARIRRHCADTCAAAGLTFTMSVDGERLDTSPPTVRLALFRIVQEALTNTVRHAGAKRVTLDRWLSDATLAIIYRDDGAGFLPERSGEGCGLVNMKRRVQAMDGTFTIDPSPDHGMSLNVGFPWPSSPATD